MKTAVFQRLIRKHLLPHLPGFRAKGWLLFAEPPRRLLRGFAFEGSGFDQSVFNVWAFVKPLYVPSTYVTFTLGGASVRCGAARNAGGDCARTTSTRS